MNLSLAKYNQHFDNFIHFYNPLRALRPCPQGWQSQTGGFA
jgi:hypothetical protein